MRWIIVAALALLGAAAIAAVLTAERFEPAVSFMVPTAGVGMVAAVIAGFAVGWVSPRDAIVAAVVGAAVVGAAACAALWGIRLEEEGLAARAGLLALGALVGAVAGERASARWRASRLATHALDALLVTLIFCGTLSSFALVVLGNVSEGVSMVAWGLGYFFFPFAGGFTAQLAYARRRLVAFLIGNACTAVLVGLAASGPYPEAKANVATALFFMLATLGSYLGASVALRSVPFPDQTATEPPHAVARDRD